MEAAAAASCLLLALLACSGLQTASAARAESITRAVGSSSRKLLSCMAQSDPSYKLEDGTLLPFCATQYFPNPSSGPGQFNRVTPDAPEPLSKANAADLAHAWSQDPVNPKTNSHLQCSGQVDSTPRQCWSGKAVEVDATFSALSCCSTSITCFVRSGGCVMH